MSDIKISIINDEISPNLKEMIDFLNSAEVKWVELRSLNGINILNLTDSQLIEIKAELDKNNIAVSAICSPLFKWPLENDVKQLEFGFKKD
jgi:sugar phosphate isomerase/epimerase